MQSALVSSPIASQTFPFLHRHLSIHRAHRHRINRCLVALASATCLVGWQSRSTTSFQSSSEQRRPGAIPPPPRFGTSIRYKHSSVPENYHEDCPICRKYSQGPCGSIFHQWLDCTDANKGVDPETKEEWHLSKCSHLATPLAQCLKKHEHFYENLSIINDDEHEMEEDLKEAWQNVIHEVEEKDRQNFPSEISPELQVKPMTGSGMAAFVYEYNERRLILAYVKDDDTGELLAAGALEDLWEWQDKYGVLRLSLPEKTRSITAHALYEADTPEAEVLYVRTEEVPPRTPTR